VQLATDLTAAAEGAAQAGEVVDVSPEFTKLSYKAALSYFTKKAPIPKSTFAKLSASMKARSFTVAGLASDASLQVAQQELARAIVEGSDLREFSKRLGDRFESAGMTTLNPSHVENVFRTNVLDTYNIGRRAEMSQPAVLKQRPYWLIRTVKDARQRATHGAVNNWVLRADDSFWSKGGPPWGYQCRCRVTSIREPRAKEMGIRSGAEIMNLPDEGFTPNALVGSSLAELLSP
jgi:SPP1 gp7 family putative phage head morphogenesis protein